jgi:HEAT repeat protein
MAAEPLLMCGGIVKKGLFILIIGLFVQPCLWAAGEQAVSRPTEVNEQLEINKNALLTGADEQIRIKAASLMLDSNDPAARAVILEVLGKSENQQARLAICQAIAASRGKWAIPSSEVFIGPLMSFLVEQHDAASVRLASEALLIFRYEQVEQPLLSVIADKSLQAEARLNAVQALRLQPDIRAIIRLIELLDDSDLQVVSAATEALKSLAIPAVDADRSTRLQMIEEIKRIGKEEFLHYWRMRQEYESQIEQLRTERDSWKQKYLAALDKLYAGFGADGAARIGFLAQYLAGARPEERLWAVSKISQWLHGTEPKSNIRSDLGPLLIKLVSDENGQVRLNTARVLALMPELDSSQTLLAQLKVETDDEIRGEQFVALGQACRYAFSPQSPLKLDGSIRKETLDMAVEYLLSDAPAKAQKGAEVIRNLLEHDGLSREDVSVYLEALAGRYERYGISNALRGELLNSMAILCGQSAYSSQAAERYQEYFVAAMSDEDDMVREAAVNGLININKSEAYRRLRADFVNDKNVNIRKRLISLAEEVGTVDDLGWLSEKMSSGAEEAVAWKAMLRIFESGNCKLLSDWVELLELKKVAPVRMIALLEIAERKAQAENNIALLNTVRYKLARLLAQTQQRDRAKEYYGDLIKTDKNPEHRDQLRAELLELYLNDGQIKLAGSLITNRLLEDDVDDTCLIGQTLISFIQNSPQQAPGLIEELQHIKLEGVGPKPLWQRLLRHLEEIQPADVNNPPLTDTT